MSDTLTDVEWMNLRLLSVLHAGVQRDVSGACALYGLTIQQARWLQGLSVEELWSLVLHAGNTLLFTPRPDLASMACVPRPLAGPFAVLHRASRPAFPARLDP
jgi:hypothetical protein